MFWMRTSRAWRFVFSLPYPPHAHAPSCRAACGCAAARWVLTTARLRDLRGQAEESGYDIERSELHMYKSMLYEEAGRYEEGLAHLAQVERDIYDDAAVAERRCTLPTPTRPALAAPHALP